jgi:hypothetical protein
MEKPRVNQEVYIQNTDAQRDIIFLYKENNAKAAEVNCENDKKMSEKLWSPNGSYLGLTKFDYQADFTYYRIEHNQNDVIIRKKLIDQMSGLLLQVEVYNPENSKVKFISYYDGVTNLPVKRDYFQDNGEFSHSSEYYYKDTNLVKFTSHSNKKTLLRDYDISRFRNTQLIDEAFSKNENKKFTTIIYDSGFDLLHNDYKKKIHMRKSNGNIKLGINLADNSLLPFELPKLAKNSDPTSSGTAYLSSAMKQIGHFSVFPVSKSKNSSDIESLKAIISEYNAEFIAINLEKKRRSEVDSKVMKDSLNSIISDNSNKLFILNSHATSFLAKFYNNVISVGVFNCEDNSCKQLTKIDKPNFAFLNASTLVSQMGGGKRNIALNKMASAKVLNFLQRIKSDNPDMTNADLLNYLKSKVIKNSKINSRTNGVLPLEI